jgi:hypothetical protein
MIRYLREDEGGVGLGVSEHVAEERSFKTVLDFARVVKFVQNTTVENLDYLTKPHRWFPPLIRSIGKRAKA